jgi:hypothetical protein
MDEIKRPLIPQFSLRWILVATAVLAVVSLVASEGLRGAAWAGGVTVGLVALVVAFLVYAMLFAVAWLTAGLARSRRRLKQARKAQAISASATTSATSVSTPILAFAIGLSGLLHQAAWAASGGSVTYPQLGPKQTNKTGLTLTIDTSWVDSCGYRPVTVEVASITGPLTADRVLSFRFLAGSWQLDGNSVAVTQTIELPAGAKSAKVVVAVPQRQPWVNCEWAVFEGGVKVEQLSSSNPTSFGGSGNSYFGDGAPPSILALGGRGQISTSHLSIYGQTEESVIFVGDAIGPAQTAVVRGPGGLTPVAVGGPHLTTLADLPTRWIDYSGIDIVLASFDELKTLIKKHPAQWRAIQTWLRSGGNLVVYGLDKKLEKLKELESLTRVAKEPTFATGQLSLPADGGWILPRKEIRELPLAGAAQYSQSPTPTEQSDPSIKKTEPVKEITLENAPFIVRHYGAGTLVAIRSDDKFAGDSFPWTWLYNTIGPERWQWHQRHGVSLTRANNDFWNFLIPGVGAAPVSQFQVLITLFVLVIGPLNYYLLRRIGKLNLMIITVPTCAVIVTGCLFLYALVADGLSVRLRARSLTYLDQRNSAASCWARLSFYAGLAPSGGLKFSDETVVLPLQPDEIDYGEGAPRELDWRRINRSDPASPLEQHLTDGWLSSRTPTQFITVRNRKTSSKLIVDQSADMQVLKVTNQLGVDVEKLLLIDESGGCFTGTQIDAGQADELSKAESQSSAALKLIEPLMVDNEPRSPFANTGESSFFGINRGGRSYYRYRGYNTNNNASDVQQNTGVLERAIRDLRERLRQDQIPPRSYVAIVKKSPEMELGTPQANEEASLHVVFGQW